MKILIAALLPLSALAQEKPAAPAKSLAAQRLHLTTAALAAPEIKVVFESEPSEPSRAWAGETVALIREWWPQVARLLATEDFKAPAQLTIFFLNKLPKGIPAYRTPEGLFISVPWITMRPDDFGMVIHEMTHAIQDYRKAPQSAGWVVEGIADYIRYWHYEPEAPHPRFDPSKATHRDAYTATPHFFAWLVHKHDRRIIRELDAALRKGTYDDALFEKLTGKTLDVLWQEFITPLKR